MVIAGLAAGLVLAAALIGGQTSLRAQAAAEGPGPAVGISLRDLSEQPTHTTVDRFMVDVANLSAAEAYQVSVSGSAATLGIGGCGTASQTRTVTGVEAETLTFLLYACAVGGRDGDGGGAPGRVEQQRGVSQPGPARGSDSGVRARGRAGGAGSGGAGGDARDCAEYQLRSDYDHLSPGQLARAERRRAGAHGFRAAVLAGRRSAATL